MKTHFLIVLAALAVVLLDGCANIGATAEEREIKVAKSVGEIPTHETTDKYLIVKYPGRGASYNPNPALTLEEHNDISQFNQYCTLQAAKLQGRGSEMVKQGALYGVLQGVFTAIGAQWGFGSIISPSAYFKYAGSSGFGGGLANGSVTFDSARRILKGYCMTLVLSDANNIDNVDWGIHAVPVYAGEAPMPVTSDSASSYLPKSGGRNLQVTLP